MCLLHWEKVGGGGGDGDIYLSILSSVPFLAGMLCKIISLINSLCQKIATRLRQGGPHNFKTPEIG